MPMNILFVDDEPLILQSMKRTIRQRDLNIFLANSAEKGLEILKANPIDIVISDMRMPEVDGVAFLTEVKRLYPSVYRLILSGYVDREIVLKAIVDGVAFEYLTKPWDRDVLRNKISRITEIRADFNVMEIVARINDITHFPGKPQCIGLIGKAIDESEDIESIADLISDNLAISTKVLQVVNSSIYSNNQISSIRKAIDVLGLLTIKNLIIDSYTSESCVDQWQCDAVQVIKRESKQVNEVFKLKYEKELDSPLPETYSFISLMYNIGKILTVIYFPNRYKTTVEKANVDGISFREAEIALGFEGQTYAEIGGYFLKLWNFSKINVEAALFHHDYMNASSENRKVLTLLNNAINEVERGLL